MAQPGHGQTCRIAASACGVRSARTGAACVVMAASLLLSTAARAAGPGGAIGGEFQVNTDTLNGQYSPFGRRVAALADGGFVVVWDTGSQDGASDGICGQRFDSAGQRAGGEFQVNTYTTGVQESAVVAADAA